MSRMNTSAGGPSTVPRSSPTSRVTQQDPLIPTDISTDACLAMLPRPEQIATLPLLQDACSSIHNLLTLLKEKNSLLSPAEGNIKRCCDVTSRVAHYCNTLIDEGQTIPAARERDISELCEHLDSLQNYYTDTVNQSSNQRLKGRANLEKIQARLAEHLDKLLESIPKQQRYPTSTSQNHPQGNWQTNIHSHNVTQNETRGSYNIRSSHSTNGSSLACATFNGIQDGDQINNNYLPNINNVTPGYGAGYTYPSYASNAGSHNVAGNQTAGSHNITSTHTGTGPNLACNVFNGVQSGRQVNNNYGSGAGPRTGTPQQTGTSLSAGTVPSPATSSQGTSSQ